MKTKTLFFLGLCTFMLCMAEAKVINLETPPFYQEDNVPTGFEIIEMQGDLLYNIGPNAIIAGYDRNSVYVHFSQSFGSVSVALHNEDGVLVYSTVVNTDVQQTLIIPLASSSGNGSYYLTLDNANGYAEGDFRRN